MDILHNEYKPKAIYSIPKQTRTLSIIHHDEPISNSSFSLSPCSNGRCLRHGDTILRVVDAMAADASFEEWSGTFIETNDELRRRSQINTLLSRHLGQLVR